MNSIKKLVIFVLCVFFSVVIQAQNSNGYIALDHIEKGRIRVKIKEEFLLNDLGAKSYNDKNLPTNAVGIANLDAVSTKVGINKIARVFPFSIKNEANHRKHGLHRWFEITFDDSIDPNAVVAQYSSLAEIDTAKPVYRKTRIDGATDPIKIILGEVKAKNKVKRKLAGKSSATSANEVDFNDPMLSDQWHYKNDGTIGTEGTDIQLLKAWTIATGSRDVIVSVVDGGIDTSHEDLVDNLWVNEAELNGEDGVDDDQNGYIDDIYGSNFVLDGPISSHSHGTHVAGTVGAVTNNGIGVAGVAGGDGSGNGVRLMSCQVFDDRVSLSGNFAAAIVYGADNGAVISQNSWGYTIPDYYEPEVLDAIRYFKAEAGNYPGSPMRGGVLFMAAGNDGQELNHYPGAFEEVIAVTAIGPDGIPAPYSNRGEWTDIAAPGGNQVSFGLEGGILSTLPNNEYGYFQGTSMACPHVSGVAALVLSKFGGEEFPAENLETIMRNAASPFNFEDGGLYGIGTLDATIALAENELIAPEAITDLEAEEVYHDGVKVAWTVPVDEDNFQPAAFYLAISTEEITSQNFDTQEFLFGFSSSYNAGTKLNVTLYGLNKLTTYYIAMKSIDLFNNASGISNIEMFTTTDEPQFFIPTNSVEIDVDVTENSHVEKIVEFQNIGEGSIFWENYINNERYYFEEQEKISAKISANIKASSLTSSGLASNKVKGLLPAQSKSIETKPDFWDYDTTEFVAGMSYEDGTDFTSLIGARRDNSPLVHANRFFIDPGFSINVTHLEVAMYPEINDKPIIIELRKGSTSVNEAKTVHLQEYYPDTTDVFKFYRIPLYKPQRFEDGETFWVVMHHPIEETVPLGVFISSRYPDHFLMSDNGGQDFYDYQPKYNSSYFVPGVRVVSTGPDGSYVFVEPGSGKIEAKSNQNVTFNIDASSLTNGKHLASVNILSNDAHKPVTTIEVKVNVTGQLGDVEIEEVQEFSVISTSTTDLELEVNNIGLSNLEISGIKSSHTGVVNVLEDEVTIIPSSKVEIPFQFNAGSVVGVEDLTITLETNEGDIDIPVTIYVKEPATLSTALSDSAITIGSKDSKTVNVVLNNTGSSTNLEYSLDYNYYTKANSNIIIQDQEYTTITSNDVGGPLANTWEDISETGDFHSNERIWEKFIDFGIEFPFYNETFSISNVYENGQVVFRTSAPYNPEELTEENEHVNYFSPFLLEQSNGLKLEKFYTKSFGDRIVYSFYFNTTRYTDYSLENAIEYQVVLFRNGAVEYRYKNVEEIPSSINYAVGFKGSTNDKLVIYKAVDDETNLVHNGMVIRFEPSYDVSMIVESDKKSGFVSPGKSETIEFTIEPNTFELVAGDYENFIHINTNTVEGSLSLPINIKVTGSPNSSVQDTVVFGKHFAGNSEKQYFNVKNEGYDIDEITSISFSNNMYSFQEQIPLTVSARGEVVLPIIFEPSNSGNQNGIMTVQFKDGSSETVVLEADVLEETFLDLNITTPISVNLNGGETIDIPFTLEALSTGGDLEFSFDNSVHAKVLGENNLPGEGNNINKFLNDYGYNWKLSDLSGNFYKWEDISETGTTFNVPTEDHIGLKLDFQFPFYGKKYDSIYISNNGIVTVVKPEKEFPTTVFEENDGVAGMIAPFWTALLPPDDTKGVLVESTEERVIVQYDGFKGVDAQGSGGTVTFQLEILNDGSIFFNYRDISSYGGLLKYGLESPDETETLEQEKAYILPWSMLKDSLTVSISAPLKGTITSGITENLNLRLSAKNIYKSGIVKDTVVLRTNSATNPLIEIPVTINVTGSSEFVGPEELAFNDVIFSENNTELTKLITIKNTGYETLTIDNVIHNNLDDLELYYTNGEKIVKTSTGRLAEDIEIISWGSIDILVKIPVEEFENVDGSIQFEGNFTTEAIPVTANIVESPIFDWNATDQVFNMGMNEVKTYDFVLENKGETALSYSLIPTGASSGSNPGNEPIVVEEIGNISFEEPIVIAEMQNDLKDTADGVFTPQVGGAFLAFSQRFVAPSEGFFLTHVNVYTYASKVEKYIKLIIYKGGELPSDGERIYEQNFVIAEKISSEWVNFELALPISIEPGETFHVAVAPPVDGKYVGYDISNDPAVLATSAGGVYSGTGKFIWYSSTQLGESKVWKIRPATAAGQSNWLELDHLSGEILAGESVTVTASVASNVTGPGSHYGKVIAVTNDSNRNRDDFDLEVHVNGAPKFEYYPNIYNDTVDVKETESIVLNYRASDPDNDEITYSLKYLDEQPNISFTTLDGNIAQMEIDTNYESEGLYEWEVAIEDSYGNKVLDTVRVNITDRNRAPIFNVEHEVIYLNVADPNAVYTINAKELFTDPDGDLIRVFAGNYSPDILDLSFGDNFLDVHPLKQGTGLFAVAGDDEKENGFTVALITVVIVDDPSAVPDGFGTGHSKLNFGEMKVSPNPVTNGNANVNFVLTEKAEVSIELFDMMGRPMGVLNTNKVAEGQNRQVVNVANLPMGVYICRISVNGSYYSSTKIIVN